MPVKPRTESAETDPSRRIDEEIAGLPEWQAAILRLVRSLAREEIPNVREEWKWNTPIWTGRKMVVAFAAFKAHVKINFLAGASLDDPDGLINAGLDAKGSRAIDVKEGDPLDAEALRRMVRRAAAHDAG